MDPVTLVIVPGFLGGLVLAMIVVLSNRRDRRVSPVIIPYRAERPSTDVINMASIKVAGVGGLGLVAMAAAVALDVPHIGQSIALGLGLGVDHGRRHDRPREPEGADAVQWRANGREYDTLDR